MAEHDAGSSRVAPASAVPRSSLGDSSASGTSLRLRRSGRITPLHAPGTIQLDAPVSGSVTKMALSPRQRLVIDTPAVERPGSPRSLGSVTSLGGLSPRKPAASSVATLLSPRSDGGSSTGSTRNLGPMSPRRVLSRLRGADLSSSASLLSADSLPDEQDEELYGMMSGMEHVAAGIGLGRDNDDGTMTTRRTSTAALAGTMRKVSDRSVSLYWLEKAFVSLEFVQVYAILLYLMRSAWPVFWVQWTSWTYLATLDFWALAHADGQVLVQPSSSSSSSSLWLLSNYLYYAELWMLVLVLAAVLLRYAQRLARAYAHRLSASSMLHRDVLVALTLRLAEATHAPVAMALLRLVACDSGTGILLADSSSVCWSASHVVVLVLAAPLAVLYLVLAPVWMIRQISSKVIYFHAQDHEQFLQLKELEYLTGMNEGWLSDQYQLFSSFRRPWVMYRPISMLFRLVLVAIVVLGRDLGLVRQSAYCCVLMLLPILASLRFGSVFRTMGTNTAWQVCRYMTLANAMMAYFEAVDLRSPLLLDSSMTVWLLVFNLTVLAVLALVATCALYRRATWPVHSGIVSSLSDDNAGFVLRVLRARAALEEAQVRHPMFVRMDVLQREIGAVEIIHKQALALHSPLASTLYDLLEDLVFQYNVHKPVSILPYPPLEQVLGQFRARLDARERDMILVTPHKRRILLKLLCVRVFRGAALLVPDDGLYHVPALRHNSDEATRHQRVMRRLRLGHGDDVDDDVDDHGVEDDDDVVEDVDLTVRAVDRYLQTIGTAEARPADTTDKAKEMLRKGDMHSASSAALWAILNRTSAASELQRTDSARSIGSVRSAKSTKSVKFNVGANSGDVDDNNDFLETVDTVMDALKADLVNAIQQEKLEKQCNWSDGANSATSRGDVDPEAADLATLLFGGAPDSGSGDGRRNSRAKVSALPIISENAAVTTIAPVTPADSSILTEPVVSAPSLPRYGSNGDSLTLVSSASTTTLQPMLAQGSVSSLHADHAGIEQSDSVTSLRVAASSQHHVRSDDEATEQDTRADAADDGMPSARGVEADPGKDIAEAVVNSSGDAAATKDEDAVINSSGDAAVSQDERGVDNSSGVDAVSQEVPAASNKVTDAATRPANTDNGGDDDTCDYALDGLLEAVSDERLAAMDLATVLRMKKVLKRKIKAIEAAHVQANGGAAVSAEDRKAMPQMLPLLRRFKAVTKRLAELETQKNKQQEEEREEEEEEEKKENETKEKEKGIVNNALHDGDTAGDGAHKAQHGDAVPTQPSELKAYVDALAKTKETTKGSCDNQGWQEKLRQARRQWKSLIRDWERQWTAQHDGTAPGREEKREIIPWYKEMKRIDALLATAEQ